MKMNDRLNGFVWGAAIGAAAAVMVGLSTGWILSPSKADVMARGRAETAVIAAMTPICVDRFQRAEGYATKLAALKQIDVSLDRRDFVAKGDWAKVGKDSNFAVAEACAEALNKL